MPLTSKQRGLTVYRLHRALFVPRHRRLLLYEMFPILDFLKPKNRNPLTSNGKRAQYNEKKSFPVTNTYLLVVIFYWLLKKTGMQK